MLEDNAAPPPGQSSAMHDLAYFSDSGTDEEDLRATKAAVSTPILATFGADKEFKKSKKSQRNRKVAKQSQREEEAEQSRYAIAGRTPNRRPKGSSAEREVIRISDSDLDSVEMDIVDDESVEEGQVGPEDYAAARDEPTQSRHTERASTNRGIVALSSTMSSEQPRNLFLPSTSKPIATFSPRKRFMRHLLRFPSQSSR